MLENHILENTANSPRGQWADYDKCGSFMTQINFLRNTQKRYPKAGTWGWGMGFLSWVLSLKYFLHLLLSIVCNNTSLLDRLLKCAMSSPASRNKGLVLNRWKAITWSNERWPIWPMHMGQVTKVGLSCYLVLLSSFDSKTRLQDRRTFVTWLLYATLSLD